MKKVFSILTVAGLLVACSTNSEDKGDMSDIPEKNQKQIEPAEEVADTLKAVAMLNSLGDFSAQGKVEFTQVNGEVYTNVMLMNVAKDGKHAIHIHEYGDCNSPDGKSAGGHWSPENEKHGKWGDDSFHKGDIGNVEVKEGTGMFDKTTDLWCLNCNDTTKNIIGKAIILHVKADDFSSQPSGAAGSRIACGVIELVE